MPKTVMGFLLASGLGLIVFARVARLGDVQVGPMHIKLDSADEARPVLGDLFVLGVTLTYLAILLYGVSTGSKGSFNPLLSTDAVTATTVPAEKLPSATPTVEPTVSDLERARLYAEVSDAAARWMLASATRIPEMTSIEARAYGTAIALYGPGVADFAGSPYYRFPIDPSTLPAGETHVSGYTRGLWDVELFVRHDTAWLEYLISLVAAAACFTLGRLQRHVHLEWRT